MALNNKQIAKNTFFLYGRMLLVMAVSLYTSRVVLNTLGIVDYGIYNVVGGVVTMFAFLNGALINTTQRYLTFEIGKGDNKKLKKVFTASIYIHAIISFLIILLAETIGLWFFYNKMVIPQERLSAAMWVYQLSIVTMVIQVMSAPYNSIIIAHEKMGIFAIISMIETSLKLLIVYLLLVFQGDKLFIYALLVAIVQLIIRFLYSRYSKKHFKETVIVRGVGKSLFIEMGKFAGWTIWGNLAATLFGTGLNLLLNVFFGPVVNAARGIAVQVEAAIAQFSTNFLLAVNPQITKLYAQNNLEDMHLLLYRSSKFACYLLLMLSLPVFLETPTILAVWLKIVPEYTVSFLRVLLCIVIIDAMSRPLMTAASATGDIKKYQAVVGGILLTIVPVSYIVLKIGGSPISVYIVHFSICVIAFCSRLLIIRPMIHLSIREYLKIVIIPCLLVAGLSCGTAIMIQYIFPKGMLFSIIVCVFSIVLVVLFAYTIGLSKNERIFINNRISLFIEKYIK